MVWEPIQEAWRGGSPRRAGHFGEILWPSPEARDISGNFFFLASRANFLKYFGKSTPAPILDMHYWVLDSRTGHGGRCSAFLELVICVSLRFEVIILPFQICGRIFQGVFSDSLSCNGRFVSAVLLTRSARGGPQDRSWSWVVQGDGLVGKGCKRLHVCTNHN